MSTLLSVLIWITALECLYIMYIETFATTSTTTSRIFGMSQNTLRQSEVKKLFKNQGIYNGLIGVGLIYAWFINETILRNFLLFYIVAVSIYGAFSSQKSILWKQGGLPFICLILHYLIG